MNTTTKTKYILGGIGALLLVGGAIYVSYMSRNIKLLTDALYNYKLGKYKDIKISFKSIRFTMNLVFDNKGDISAKVLNQNYKVYANGVYVSKAYNDEVLKIKSDGVTNFPIKVEIKVEDMIKAGLKNASQLLTNPEDINIEIKGSFDFKAGIVGMNKFPFETSFKIGDLT